MKAVGIKKTGGPEVLELKDIKLADPSNGEVLIKQVAIGLNYIDTYHSLVCTQFLSHLGLV
tara:strand:- start:581 stop:763 length:183 start_codon:yes stop_codon:yes gene_type:complete